MDPGYHGDRMAMTVRDNLSCAKRTLEKHHLGMTLDQLLAHELGHSTFLRDEFNDRNPTGTELVNNTRAVYFENVMRANGPFRTYHDPPEDFP